MDDTRVDLGRASEDYLKAIFKLEPDKAPVTTSKLAEALQVSPAAATKAIQVLSEKELVEYRPYRGVTLTEAGSRAALEMIRHHRLLELFLHDVLGYGWEEVDEEAERLEHHISEKFEAAIDRLMDYPTIDPHGDPIPTREGQLAVCDAKPLTEFARGDVVVIRRVRNDDPEALQYLDAFGLRLNTKVKVMDVQPFNGPLTLLVADEIKALGRELAGYLFVVQEGAADVKGAASSPHLEKQR